MEEERAPPGRTLAVTVTRPLQAVRDGPALRRSARPETPKVAVAPNASIFTKLPKFIYLGLLGSV